MVVGYNPIGKEIIIDMNVNCSNIYFSSSPVVPCFIITIIGVVNGSAIA